MSATEVSSTYTYRVRDRSGKVRTGEIEGASTARVAEMLREQGMTPLRVEAKSSGMLQREIKLPGFGNRVKGRDVVIFSRQFATMINSGLSLIRALGVLVDQTPSPALAEILRQVRSDVREGASLSQAMEKHPKAFGELYVAMIRAGEVGGVLDETLNRLATMLEANLNLRSKVRSAMAYPTVIAILITAVTTAMIVFVVPIFSNLYAELDESAVLPLPTRMLVGMSTLVTHFWFLAVGLIVGGVWGLRRWRATPAGRLAIDRFKLKVPVLGRLAHKTAMSRFSRTMAVLSGTGVPILQAIDIVGDTAGNQVVTEALTDVKESVRAGESLAEPLSRHKVFPPMVVQMMMVGEETGALEEMLAKVSDFYDREVDDTVNALTSLIEPLLIVVMGATVGGILIALYLPIFNLASLVNG
jgi:type IV pilus assembly protein PilC